MKVTPPGRATRFARCIWSEVVTQPPRQGNVASLAGSIFPGYEALTQQKSQLQGLCKAAEWS